MTLVRWIVALCLAIVCGLSATVAWLIDGRGCAGKVFVAVAIASFIALVGIFPPVGAW
jgi:hypothetical protein